MPIFDSNLMLRDGSAALTTTETGDYVHVGKSGFHGSLLGIFLPAALTTVTIVIQMADDASGTNVETVESGSPPAAITTGAAFYTYRLFNSRPWLRYVVSAITGTPGAVQIGVCEGDLPDPF
jgi:hypothetical protein